ncbi:MAG: hypothetical protein ACD_7C00164G0003 [uncultured bacterium]|nr:MAG: hypothetical protein ACD_7C00164G0003 [uncultured bacterium]
MKKISFNNVHWIDFENPDSSSTRYLQENFNIHPLAIEEFVTPTIRPKATVYPSCIFLTLHIPLYDTVERTTYPGELDIVITKDYLITGHDHKIFQLTSFFEKLQSSEGKKRIYMNASPAHLLYYLVETLLESCFPRLDHIHKNIDIIENHVFNGDEKEMVQEISIAKRDILNFRRALKPQRSILESLVQMDTHHLVGKNLKDYYQNLVGINIRLWSSLESAKETIESLEETNNSLLSNKLNMTMKVLTIFSAVMLPMTVYSNILAMSANIPFGSHPYGFWIHMGIMLALSLLTIFSFKLNKWI